MNPKRLFRLYREEKLGVRKRNGRKRARGVRTPIPAAGVINDRWSLEFVHDQLTDGRRFRIWTVVDDATRECLALVADTSISGARVARKLDRIVAMRGKPRTLVSDNGTELTSNTILAWAQDTGPGKKANAERLYREFQRLPPGRVLERDLNPVFAAGPDGFGTMTSRLQLPAAALAAEVVDATSLSSIAKGFAPSQSESSTQNPFAFTAKLDNMNHQALLTAG